MCEYLFTTHPRPDGLWSGGLQRCNPAVAVQLGGMVEVATSCNITTIRYITAQLRVPHLISMGQGLFKMAHQAYITVASLSREPVVVKQVYFTHAKLRKPAETAVTRYDPVNEFTKTVTEANLLFWGTSLFQSPSSFVDNHILKAAQPAVLHPSSSICLWWCCCRARGVSKRHSRCYNDHLSCLSCQRFYAWGQQRVYEFRS